MERRAEFDNNVTLSLPPGPAVPPVPPLLLRPELKTGVHTKCRSHQVPTAALSTMAQKRERQTLAQSH